MEPVLLLAPFLILVAYLIGVPLWQIVAKLEQIAEALNCSCNCEDEEEPTDANPSN